MSFATFKLLYASVGILGSMFALWRVRQNRQNFLGIIGMTVVMGLWLFAGHLVADKQSHRGGFSEALFRAFTHVNGDTVLLSCNIFLWGTVPFAAGLALRRKGRLFVWLFFGSVAAVKTWFEDFFLIHHYPEIFVDEVFEWEYFLISWIIVYGLAALFITKGLHSIKEHEKV